VLRRARAVVVLDACTQAALVPETPRPIVCIPVFIRPEAVRAEIVTAGPKTDLVYAGWMIAPKGVPELIEAWAPLTDVRLRLLGPYEPAYGPQLQALAGGRALDLAGMVSRRALLEGIAGATTVVLPSHGEGTPLVVLEAMALGVPVIATRVGSIPHLLDFDGAEPCGVPVPAGDPSALRDVIRHVLADPAAAAAMGARAQRRLDAHFSAAALFPRLVDVWRMAAGRS
jgi:glycosyltransferase involved in cell wall biosynthesis